MYIRYSEVKIHYLKIFRHIAIYIYGIHPTEGLFKVAIERCPEWDLNPRLLNSVQML